VAIPPTLKNGVAEVDCVELLLGVLM
jgi:hypothetical protein